MKKIYFFCLALLTAGTMLAEVKTGTWQTGSFAGLKFSYDTETLVGTIIGFDDQYLTSTVTLPATDTVEISGQKKVVTFSIIASEAFKDNTTIAELTIPETYDEVGVDAFYNTKIEKLTLNAKKVTKGLGAAGTNISWFGIQSELETIVIGATVEEIPKYLAYNTSTLKSLSMPNSGTNTLKAIGKNAFANTSLTSVNFKFPDGLEIGEAAFYGCKSLESITNICERDDAKGVTAIGKQAFMGCTKFERVSGQFSANLTSIGEKAFYQTALEYVLFDNDNLTVEQNAFGQITAKMEAEIRSSQLPLWLTMLLQARLLK